VLHRDTWSSSREFKVAYDGVFYEDAADTAVPQVVVDSPTVFVVTGSTPWGHVLLYSGSSGWFHITHPGLTYPRHIPKYDDFNKYLKENDKYVLGYLKIVDATNLAQMARAIRTSLKTSWFYGGFVHNCVNYAEAMLQAGGSKFVFKGTNFPTGGLEKARGLHEQHIVGDFSTRTEKEARKSTFRW
jgi:hypothetical protein